MYVCMSNTQCGIDCHDSRRVAPSCQSLGSFWATLAPDSTKILGCCLLHSLHTCCMHICTFKCVFVCLNDDVGCRVCVLPAGTSKAAAACSMGGAGLRACL